MGFIDCNEQFDDILYLAKRFIREINVVISPLHSLLIKHSVIKIKHIQDYITCVKYKE